MMLLKKWDPSFRQLSYNRETRQLILVKSDSCSKAYKPDILDLRILKEVHTLDFKLNMIKISDKWAKDKEIRQFDPTKILVLSYGNGFVLNYWILLFEVAEICRMWCQGVHYLMMDTISASHALVVERWIRKEFYNMTNTGSDRIERKHMKPFVQISLQYKVQFKILQEITEDEMNFDMFANAYRTLLFQHDFFMSRFSIYSDDSMKVSFNNFIRFLMEMHFFVLIFVFKDEMGNYRDRTSDFMRRYLKEFDSTRDIPEPSLSISEFCDFLFSRENSVWDPINEQVVHDMNRPLSHYWIASSHNTYLTGDQLKSESSLDAYARCLLMGCRCIELDCWDGHKRSADDCTEIVIYHGYTMTSKLNLRDVLYTIRHYAFINSDYPVIISIEDNCSVPAQRLLAQEIKTILGDLLLTAPINRDEHELPSPAALKRKIILKHKKLPTESEDIASQPIDDYQDHDLLSRNCIKRGILSLKDSDVDNWTKHIFILFPDRLCYMLDDCEAIVDDNTKIDGNVGEDDSQVDDSNLVGFGVQPDEMHVTEEWFHSKTSRNMAESRLLEHRSKGNGLFLVRDSNVFIGDYSLSFLHNGKVHHCRIRTRMVDGRKKFYFLENKQMDTLYELISYYTEQKLRTPNFSTKLVTPCPQPSPHLNMPWFAGNINKSQAEELLNMVHQDGAFLIRYSSTDKNVFVLSLRANDAVWHYRLKRNGRIFVVNQTVFENLNQIVDFYSSRELVWGTCLKIAVNGNIEVCNLAAQFAESTPGCYLDLKELDKEIFVRAIEPYVAKHQSELSFPVNSVITVIKKDGCRYWGRYGPHSGFFPSQCVVEIVQSDRFSNEVVNYGTIELAGSLIAKIVDSNETTKPFAFKISPAAAHWNFTEHILAANSCDDQEDWLNTLHELTRTATSRFQILRLREKNLRIASELSNLVVYCQAVPFNASIGNDGNFYEMCSFSETKHDKLLEKGLVRFNTRQLSRVYPQGSRVTSTNYDPMPMWNSGCHMVALNYQTGDRAMQLNQGKFMANGQCGYVLKPSYLIDEKFAADVPENISHSCPIMLTIQVIAGRHLARKDKTKGICSPTVEVEIVGIPTDSKVVRTRAVASNGLNPIWNQTFSFNLLCPELALIRFYVEDGDFVGPQADPFIGQAVYPVDCIRTGFRSVILRNQHSDELELSALLVHIDVRRRNSSGELLNPFVALQAGRSMAGISKSLSSSSGLFLARVSSIDQNLFSPSSFSPTNPPSKSVDVDRSNSLESTE
ncbi:unnamed protein product [Dracunculus medinensis]|uniref:Phosphoinositide phospholipase C n=1 Tax=Dracunculus medinensis TaxID=318479 RepID=A0A0N4U311_DRAME|nr:unnamed protein product [Dracunculus medinensis]